MTQLSKVVLASDLDHIIGQRPTVLTGVLPQSIKDQTFTCSQTILEENRQVDLNGIDEEITATFVLRVHDLTGNLPSLGSVLKDNAGKFYKIMAVRNDDPNEPVGMSFDCIERYSGE